MSRTRSKLRLTRGLITFRRQCHVPFAQQVRCTSVLVSPQIPSPLCIFCQTTRPPFAFDVGRCRETLSYCRITHVPCNSRSLLPYDENRHHPLTPLSLWHPSGLHADPASHSAAVQRPPAHGICQSSLQLRSQLAEGVPTTQRIPSRSGHVHFDSVSK